MCRQKNYQKHIAIVHTTQLCGAGVAYVLSKALYQTAPRAFDTHLELVALATVSDLVPLKKRQSDFIEIRTGKIKTNKRAGLLALFKEAGIDQKDIGVYEIGHIIAPRLKCHGKIK